jgi:hypothetical protein
MQMNTGQKQITIILAFPILLTVGIVLIPVVTDYTDHQLAEQVVAQVGRWFFGHILSAIAFPLSILAINGIDRHLHQAANSLPRLTLPFVAVGAGLYSAGLGADGIGPIAVQAAGFSPVIFFDGSGMWVTGIFILGTIIFGIGLIMTVIGAVRHGLVLGWSRYICFGSALLFMGAPAVLSGWALYGVAVASFGVFVPLAVGIISGENSEKRI